MGYHGVAPTFTQGQIMSSGAHTNALQRYIQALHDSYCGPRVPFHGFYRYCSIGWERGCDYVGMIRHKTNRLSYIYEIRDTGTAEIQIDSKTVPGSSHTGAGSYQAANVDISSLGLTVNDFYYVQVVGDADFTLLDIHEVYNPSYPLLSDFSDDVQPTEAQFQALSTYADMLDVVLSAPRNCGNDWKHVIASLLQGNVEHSCRYLSYSIRVDVPQAEPGSGKRATWVELFINGTKALHLRAGKNNGPTGDYDTYYHWAVPDYDYIFEGTLDLEKYPIGSVVDYGEIYIISITWGEEGHPDDSGETELNYVYEIPEPDAKIDGFVSMTSWAHGALVRGNINAYNDPCFTAIKNNLELLGSHATYLNYPTRVKVLNDGLYNVRRYRWLHVLATWDPTPDAEHPNGKSLGGEIVYTYRGELKQVNLPSPPDQATYGTWIACDLDSFEGLYVGVYYYLHDVDYAIEDKDP